MNGQEEEDPLRRTYAQGWKNGREHEKALLRERFGHLVEIESLAEAYNLGWRLGSNLMVATLLEKTKDLALLFDATQQRIKRGELATTPEIAEEIGAKVRVVENYVAFMQEGFKSLKDVEEEIARVVPWELQEDQK